MRTATRLPALETPSLILREILPRDSVAFCNFMMQDDYQRFIAMRLASAREVEMFVARAMSRQGDQRRSAFQLAAEEKLSGEAIGDGFLIRSDPRTFEIGWGLHPAMWRMGLGQEIGTALLALAFERLGADRAWCKIMRDNTASTKLAQRLGLHQTRTVADYPASLGHVTSVDIFSIKAAEYFDRAY
ncbi:GNAT family N-acetyltransferase [Aestuariivirga sp.]|jgi:RimJ/RimL family protein N-acetyltransferase|uniref:GNAT family N-acetyltransferase n=1 Tax=Aestuariivirga sp. TaxID=2650926 RepID=UPI003782F8A2